MLERNATLHFGDASMHIWEEGAPPPGQRHGLDPIWERTFKEQVFALAIVFLRKHGWRCVVPPDLISKYGASFARHTRYCTKGDLKAEIRFGGRHIELQMWQSVNTPTRPDHGGKYEWDKEGCMPYLIRLTMEHTRRKLCKHLCATFTGYHFDQTNRGSIRTRPLTYTAIEVLQIRYKEATHYKGSDWSEYLRKNSHITDNCKSADGKELTHGSPVWFYDSKGRLCAGIAYYNIANMWWVISGKYSITNLASFNLFSSSPGNPRLRRNDQLRRSRLQELLAKAISKSDFRRAQLLHDLIFPTGEPLFVVYHKDHRAYHLANFNGYTRDLSIAGRFTAAEVRDWNAPPNKVIALAEAA